MKLAIFGATGNTGIETTKQALEKGHHVTAFVRDPSRMPLTDDHLTLISDDIFAPNLVESAVQGQDAVICALGSRDLKKSRVRAAGTANIITAMKQTGVQRLMVVSAMGVGESWETLSFINKFFFAAVLKSAREDHEAQERLVKNSGLNWTIIRPSSLTDTPRTGTYLVGEKIKAQTSQISRSDVADLILKELEQNELIGKAVTITN